MSMETITQTLLAFDSPTYVRRLARAINAECGANGFYSGFGVTPEMQWGQRKFFGHVKVIGGRLMAREVGAQADGDSSKYSVDLTGAGHVNGNGNGEVSARRQP
jgi:hypothetical protein